MRTPPAPIGLIAGAGRLPIEFARQASARKVPVRAVLIQGAAEAVLRGMVETHVQLPVGRLGAAIDFFKGNGVRTAVLLGKVQHSLVLRDPRVDWRAIRLLARLPDRSGATVLKGIAEELAKDGIRLIDSRTGMEGCLARKKGTEGRPNAKALSSLRWGLPKARALAREGIGQSLLVKGKAVVAVEGIEGTDEAVLRAGRWAGKGCILIKVSGPRQDWRFDVPTIGPGTVQALVRAKAQGMVIEAGKCFLLEADRVRALARSKGIFIHVI